ncbi:MAG: SGNH/GDSL hydrolase family protein [Planctomycetota bacterium]
MRRLSPKGVGAGLLLLLIAGLIMGEWVARFGLELGDPVLMQSHPSIEYLPQPNQDVRVAGTRHRINAFGMRSDDPPPADQRALRVLVLGDSVINGGRRTDHAELATTLAQAALSEQLGGPVWVGNASAGSWGPGNWLAYVDTFGTFDADIAVLVVSPHDLGDTPQFLASTAESLTTRKPWTALGEALGIGWERLRDRLGGASTPNVADLNQPGLPVPSPDDPRRLTAEADLRSLLEQLWEAGISVAMLYFPEADADGRHDEVRSRFQTITETHGGVFVDMRERFLSDNPSNNPAYRDRMHPSLAGQRLLADAMVESIVYLRPTDHSNGTPAATEP